MQSSSNADITFPTVQDVTTVVGSSEIIFGNATVVPSTTITTVVTHTVVGSTLYLDGFQLTGQVDGEITFVINTLIKMKIRSAEMDRNGVMIFPAPIKLTVGDIVDVKIEHFDTGTFTFNATLFGHRS